MALTATVHHLKIALSDVDRGVYEDLDLRLARHPSETMRYLVTRTIAYCLLFEEGITFAKGGLSSTDEPAVSARTLDGILKLWVEVGTPSAERLHKAAKAAPRVVVFTQHDPELVLREMRSRPIHRVETIEVFALEPSFLDAVGDVTERSARWELLHTEGQLYVTVVGQTLSGPVSRHVA
jgi:uncharacterized protein YaeQ